MYHLSHTSGAFLHCGWECVLSIDSTNERLITDATHKRISFIMNIRMCLQFHSKLKLFLTEDTLRALSLPGLHADGMMLFQIEFISKT